MKVVLDSNVIAAAFAARGLCSDLFNLILSQHEFAVSEALLKEVEKTLSKKIKLPARQVAEIVEFLKDVGCFCTPSPVASTACRDRADLHILGLADAANAEFVITGDEDLLVLKKYRRTRIKSPRDFWRLCRGM